jgi:hypothetical protein
VGVSCTEKTRSTNTTSDKFTSPEKRVAFACDYLLCITKPTDAAFHIQYVDHSRDLIPSSDTGDVRQLLKVNVDEIHLWQRECEIGHPDMHPFWMLPLLTERNWKVTSIPVGYVCGHETRVIHVKEGVIIRQLKLQ